MNPVWKRYILERTVLFCLFLTLIIAPVSAAKSDQHSPVAGAPLPSRVLDMSGDYLRLVEQKLGVQFKRVPKLSWQEAFARQKRWEIDMDTCVSMTASRLDFWAFTKPYLRIPIVIATQQDVTYIADMKELFDKALDAITEAERSDIYRKWVPIRYEHGFDNALLWQASAVFAVILLVLVLWIRRLTKEISNRQRAEELLSAKKEEIDIFFSVALDLLCIADTDGNFCRLNPQWQAVLGYPVAELEGKPFLTFVHPEDLEATMAAISQLSDQLTVLNFTNRYRCRDGSYRWIEWRSIPAGSTIYASARDITDRKRTEESLSEKSQFIESLLRAIPIAVFFKDKEGRYLGCNDTFTQIMGATAEEIRGKTSFEIWPGELADTYHRMDLDIMQNQEHQEYEFKIKDKNGKMRPVIFAKDVYFDKKGQVAGLVGAFIDITDRKNAEEALRRQTTLFLNLFEGSPEAIAILDHDDRVLELNRSFETIFGYTEREAIGRHINDLLAPEPYLDDARTVSRAVIWGGQIVEKEAVRCMKGGRPVHVSLIGYPIVLNHRQIGAFAIYRDITERMRSEEALRNSLLEKESLLKEVHHRVKNNLQIISSLLNLQARKVHHPEILEPLQDTQNRIRSMALLHETIYRSGNLATVSIPDYIKRVCEHLARSYAGAEKIRLLNDIADVTLDMDRAIPVGLIISELVSNAFKHGFPSGKAGEIFVELQAAPEQRLILRVSDNGIGIPAETDLQNTGTLGLQLVHNLARQLDGLLTCDSGQRTVFEMIFPRNPREEY